MAEWHMERGNDGWDGRMAEWQNGRMAEWQNGRMAEWQNGRMAEWQNGRVAGMADGMVEWQNRMAEQREWWTEWSHGGNG